MFGLSGIVNAQNLATNGDLELWTAGVPDNWNHVENITQETTIVHGGTYSAKHEAASSTKDFGHENITGIVAGNDYDFSFYYLDNDDHARMRVWSKWKDAGGATVGSTIESTYSVDDPAWQLYNNTITAPAGATQFYIEVRAYKEDNGDYGGFVYYDDFVFENAGAATPAMVKAFTISDTEINIEYNIDVTSVSASDYLLTGSASITFSGATIDGTDPKIVHLTGASVNMTGDNTLDNIADAANTTDFDFYAGIMSISYTNPTNPSGVIDEVHLASYIGIISANDAYNNVWISDAAGERNGVMIYDYDFDNLVSVGDEVLITATRTVYSSLTELTTPELLSTISTGNTPYGPSVIDGSDIDENIAAETDPGEKWEGQLVKIENFTVDSYVDYDYTCSWVDGATTYYFHIGDNVDYQFGAVTLNVGETYGSITGVVDWYNSGPYYRINPREQADVVAGSTAARIVGSMQGWDETDPDYVMTVNANGLYVLTKSLDAGDWEYKVLEGDDWSQPSFPGSNEHVVLTATEDVTWKANITTDFVMHTLPIMTGDFLSEVGGTDWDPADLLGEMTDPDGDETYTLELTIPAGDYNGKVTLNHGWVQSTSGDIPFTTDGVTPTTFTYDFLTNTTTISGPPPPTVVFTFIVDDTESMNYDGFYLKGSWDADGYYDPSWGGGAEHSAFYDDGTNGDVTAGDHIWTCQQELVVDGGTNTWEWGVNDSESSWIVGNWQFTVPDQTPQTLEWIIPAVVDLVINEIMYNSVGTDEEWIELYNNTTQTIDLENWQIGDNSASNPHIIIPTGYSVAAGEYFTISIATGGAFPFTPDYDGTGNFALNNGGDDVRVWNADYILVDIVTYDDGSPWPTEPDGDGPSLSLLEPELDNSLAENWDASREDGGTPGAENFPPLPYVTIVNPNGGEFISQGDAYDITWIYDFWTGDIDIKLVKEGFSPLVIGSDIVVADEVWTWNVSDAIQVGDDYKIMIVPVDPTNPSDESDDYFSIIEPYVIPEIVITEIMYNPPESGTDSLEFLELYSL